MARRTLDFDQLYIAYWPRIHGFCHRICGNRADADDLAQEVFLTVYQQLHSLREEAAVTTWMYRIALRQSTKFMRGRRKAAISLAEANLDLRAAPEGDLEAVDRAVVRQALAELPESLREAIILVKLEGLTSAEAAVVLGRAEGTVRWRVHQGLNQLRALLHTAADEEQDPPATAAGPAGLAGSQGGST